MMKITVILYYLLIAAIIFDLAIAFFVLFLNKNDSKHQLYFITILGVVFWQTGNLITSYYLASISEEQYIFIIKSLYGIGIFIPILYMKFSTLLIKDVKPYLFSILLLTAIAFSIVSYSDVLVNNFIFAETTATFNFGPAYVPFAIFFSSLIIYTVYLCISHYKKTKNTFQKKQISYLLIAISIPFAVTTTGNVIIPFVLENFYNLKLSNDSPIFNIGPISTPFFSIIIAYTIIRHRMMDVVVKIQRSTIVWFIFGVTAALLSATSILLHTFLQPPLEWTVGIAIVLSLFLAQPVKQLATLLAKKITKKRIISLYAFTKEEQEMLEKANSPQKISRDFASHLQKEIPVEHLTIYTYDHYAKWYQASYGSNTKTGLDLDAAAIKALKEQPKHLHTSEELQQQLNASYILPLYHEGTERIIGVITFGERVDGRPLNDTERAWLLKQQSQWERLLWAVLQQYYFVQDHIDKGTIRKQKAGS